MAELSGQTFAGYEILAKLGEGGFGAVYKARQPNLNRLVALKILAPHLAADADFVARFKREATLAASFNHPNLVLVFAAGESDGSHYMAMEFVEGETLRNRIESHGRLEPREATAITVYVAQALQYAWNKSRLIHRDIKPDNVFVSRTGEVKVGDLGLAKNVGQSTAGMTATGMMMGSPHYISPEQASAKKDIDFRADIYSLGCTLYHMLTGRLPYEGDEPMAVMNLHVNAPPPAIFKVWPTCPMPLALLVGKMLKKNPRERHASYEELIAELTAVHDKIAAAQTAAAAPPSGTITFLFTDIEGSTQLWEKHPQAMPIALERHNQILRRAMESHGGFVFKTVGDAFCVAFASAPNAMAAALAGQRALSSEPWGATGPLRVRMALHTGAAEERGGDYFGPTVNRVARVLAAGHGGQVLLSNATEQLVRDHLAEGVSLGDLGERSLKNLTRTERIFQVNLADMPTQFPTLRAAASPSTTRRRRQRMMLYGGAGVAAVAVLAGLLLWSPWKERGASSMEREASSTSLQHSATQIAATSTGEHWQDWMTEQRRSGKIPNAYQDDGRAWVKVKPGLVNLENSMRNGAARATFALPDQITAIAALDLRSTKDARSYRSSVMRKSVFLQLMEPQAGGQAEESPRNTKILKSWPMPKDVDVTQEVTIEFRAVGDELSIKVNDHLIGTVHDSTYDQAGEVAVYCKDSGTRISRIEVLNLDGVPSTSSAPDQPPAEKQDAVNLLPLIDPEKDAVEGKWMMENGSLRCETDATRRVWARMEIPYKPPEEYDFRIVFVPKKPTGMIYQVLRGGGRTFQLCIGGAKPGTTGRFLGFEIINGKSAGENPSGVLLKPDLEIGRHYTSLVQVRKDGVKSFLDGRLITEWKTDYQDMTMFNSRRLRDDQLLGIGDTDGAVFHRIEVREVTGKGTFTRGGLKETGILAPTEARVGALTANPKAGEVCTLDVGKGVTMDLMGIPPGEFLLGSTKEEQAWKAPHVGYIKNEGEAPRKTTIKQGFWMGRTEVTVVQWKEFVTATGYKTEAEKKGYVDNAPRKDRAYGRADGLSWRDPGFGAPPQDNHPVCCVAWNDAVAFCEWLTERERKAGRLPAGHVVRLPTEAEWEYACRAGTQTMFWWGEKMEDSKGKFNFGGKSDGFELVAPVDSYGEPGRNKFGLADMLGNVQEWCLDGYDPKQAHEEYYKGAADTRVLRSGSFRNNILNTRCAYRVGNNRATANADNGFRVVVGADLSGATTAAVSASPAGAPKEDGILAPVEKRVSALTANSEAGEVFTLDVGKGAMMDLMGIPPGEFMLGSTKEEQEWAVASGGKAEYTKREGETPRKAAIKQGFWMGRTEVTVGQWKQFVAVTGHQSEAEKKGNACCYDPATKTFTNMVGKSWRDPSFGAASEDNHPVCCVSWYDAVVFCEWLTEREQKAGRLPSSMVVRLPTEAEWEYACRAGTQTKFWWGDTKEEGEGRLNWSGTADGFQFVAPADHYGARGRNGFGLADMVGNVQEWCLDNYDPTGAHEECCKVGTPRVLRGGSFYGLMPALARCACRNSNLPDASNSSYGFRVVVASSP